MTEVNNALNFSQSVAFPENLGRDNASLELYGRLGLASMASNLDAAGLDSLSRSDSSDARRRTSYRDRWTRLLSPSRSGSYGLD